MTVTPRLPLKRLERLLAAADQFTAWARAEQYAEARTHEHDPRDEQERPPARPD